MSRSRSKSISVHEQVQFLLRSRSRSQSRSSSWSIPGSGPSLFQDKLNDFYGVVLGLSLAILIISDLFLQKNFGLIGTIFSEKIVGLISLNCALLVRDRTYWVRVGPMGSN